MNSGNPNSFSSPGEYKTVLWFPENFFNNGYFSIGVAISTLDPVQVHVADYNALTFEILDVLDAKTRNGYTGKFDGYLRPELEWINEKMN